MSHLHVSAEVITSIIIGCIQLAVGLISLWQQQRVQRPNGKLFGTLEISALELMQWQRRRLRGDILSKRQDAIRTIPWLADIAGQDRCLQRGSTWRLRIR